MSTKPKRRALSKADQRELARQLTGILERVYDGTLDASGHPESRRLFHAEEGG